MQDETTGRLAPMARFVRDGLAARIADFCRANAGSPCLDDASVGLAADGTYDAVAVETAALGLRQVRLTDQETVAALRLMAAAEPHLTVAEAVSRFGLGELDATMATDEAARWLGPVTAG